MINAGETPQGELIEAFAQASLGICHDLINYFIFDPFFFQKLTGSHNAISVHVTKSQMLGRKKAFLMRFSDLFLPKSEEFLA